MTNSSDDIERVRQAADIVEIIGEYVALKRKGRGDLWGLCPFHSEKTPSFHVRPEAGVFHCFGCGKGGNVFTFIMEMNGMSFGEALRLLAERTGVPLTARFSSPEAERKRSEKDRLYRANSFAADWFHQRLTAAGASRDARRALDYLHERGLNDDIIHRFKLGWSDASWDGLVNAAARAGVKEPDLATAGLALRRKDGSGYVDRFRGRVMFPIHNLTGKPVGFGGRIIAGLTPGEDEAKYINTPETPIYIKGEVLFGLDRARESIRKADAVFLVEGYTDLLALVSAGVENTAATLGTALTPMQARLLKRFASRVNIVYDADPAGVSATLRAADTLVLEGMEPRLVRLPEGEDPDSLLRGGGADRLREVLAGDLSFVQFRLEAAGVTREMSQTQTLEAARELLETLRSVTDPLQGEVLLRELSEFTGIRLEALDRALARMKPRPAAITETPSPTRLTVTAECVPERDLVRALLKRPALIADVAGEVSSDSFRHAGLKSIYLTLERAHIRGEKLDVASMPNEITDPALRSFVSECLIDSPEADAVLKEEALECAAKLRQRDLREEIESIENQIRRAGGRGEPTRELMGELMRRQKELRGADGN